AACVDPLARRSGMLPIERTNSREPRQQRAGLVHLAAPVIDLVVGGALGRERPGRTSPAVVMHPHVGEHGTNSAMSGSDAETLRIAERVDLECRIESHRADLAPIPATVHRNGVEATVEVNVPYR